MGADGLEWNCLFVPPSEWKCEPEKNFLHNHSSYVLSKKYASRCQLKFWDSHDIGSIPLKSLNSHPLDEDVYEDDLRIHYFPTYVSSFFMNLHDPPL